MTLENAKAYLNRLEVNRKKDEPNNKRTYQDARNLAAWVSVAEYGNEEMAKRALKIINKI